MSRPDPAPARTLRGFPAAMDMDIAGVRFSLCSDAGIDRYAMDPAYDAFVVPTPQGHGPASDVIRLRIRTGVLPDIRGLKKFFDTGHSWAMFRGVDRCWIALPSPERGEPLWLAEMNRDFTEGTVHCGPALVRSVSGASVVSNPLCYPLDQILLMYALGRRQGLMVHASGIDLNGRALIFPGRSGAGKSTIAGQFNAKGVGKPLSDDRIALRKRDGIPMAYGTPWPGQGGLADNRGAPLAGLFFIRQAHADRLEKIGPGEALKRLFPVASVPWYDPDLLPRVLDVCADLVARVSAYDLGFRKDGEVVDALAPFIGA